MIYLTKKNRQLVLILVLILLILLGLCKCRGFENRTGDASNVVIGAGVREGERESEHSKPEVKSNGKSEMTVRINGYPVFADGGSKGNLNIENPAVNELCMNVEITLNSTGAVIYDSGAIPPNHYIDTDGLTEVLAKGIYEATAHVTLFDPDHPGTNFNSANFTLVITIEN